APPALRLHVREGGVHRPQRAVVAHPEGAVDHGIGLELDTAGVAASPGVVDQNVDGAELFDRDPDHRLDLIALGDVDVDETAADLVRHGPPAGLVDLADDHLRALGREGTGDPGPDAVAGAGDDRDAA